MLAAIPPFPDGGYGWDVSLKGRIDLSWALLPECLEDWVSEDNAVHVIDAFVEALDLHGMGFERVIAKETGQPSYHPAVPPSRTLRC
ncbi:hypothetical protein [Bradyrhizobium sp. 31Argb]|uniref:hypothetical protein n=1 Tax=Bradyrhizobium sp. 31Argb TaxID=3141247 RepID=UPI00102E5D9E